MKIYLYAAAAVALLGLFAAVYYMGGSGERAKSAEIALKHAQRETALLEEIQKAKEKREVVYRDKIKIVDRVVDSCLDTTMPDDIRMQLSGGGKAK